MSVHVVTLLLRQSDSDVVVALVRRYLQSPVQGLHPHAVHSSVHEVLTQEIPVKLRVDLTRNSIQSTHFVFFIYSETTCS